MAQDIRWHSKPMSGRPSADMQVHGFGIDYATRPYYSAFTYQSKGAIQVNSFELHCEPRTHWIVKAPRRLPLLLSALLTILVLLFASVPAASALPEPFFGVHAGVGDGAADMEAIARSGASGEKHGRILVASQPLQEAVSSADDAVQAVTPERCTGLDLGRVKRSKCPRIATSTAPSQELTPGSKTLRSSSKSGVISQTVMSESGDILKVELARPANLYERPNGSLFSDCSPTIPFIGSSFDPCGFVTIYDAARESYKKAPPINIQSDAQYDACGTLISKHESFNWQNEEGFAPTGWYGGQVATVPANEPPECLGEWLMTWTWTQTFSDGEKLTDSITVPYLVTAVPIPPSATWGGGNPSELSCSQICGGDPVNTATGDFSESINDLTIAGRGPGLQMTRTYSSLAARAGVSSVLGRGWALSYGITLSVNSQTGYATVTNANGSQTQFQPGGSGFVAPPRVLATLVKNGDGTYAYTVKARTIYTFDASGKLTSIADLNGKKTTFAYNPAGQLQTATDSSGRTFTFGYNGSGKLASVTDSTGRKVSYGYNGSGQMTEVTDVRGGHSGYTYDAGGLLLTHKDARENTVLTNTYDATGRVMTQTDGLKNKTTYSYTESGDTKTTDVTNPREYVTEYEYFKGSLVKQIEALGTESSATWTYEHDPNTLGITEITDPNGHTSHATYDFRGNQTATEDALGHTTKAKYDSLNDLIESTDANGVTTIYTYDSKGNLLSSSTPLVGSNPPKSRTVTYTYGSKSFPEDVLAVTDPNGKAINYTYDTAGNLTSETDAAGNKTTYTYDALGRRLTKVSPRGYAKGGKASEFTTTYTYDAAGNRLTATDPLGHKRKSTYDANGNVGIVTDANEKQTTYSYDASNQRISVTRADGRIEKTAYDGNGNVLSNTNGLEKTNSYTYNPLDQRASSTDALQRTTSFSYDGASNLKSTKDPKGRTTTFSYDDADRLVEMSYSDGTTPAVKYGYDAVGRRTSMSDGTGNSAFSFDSLGRLTSTTTGHGDATSYGYDLAGNETSITYPNGKKVTRTFDSAERLASVSDWLGNATSFAYDADSNVTAITFPTATTNVDSYSYNRDDQVIGATMLKGKTTQASLTYTRDNNGQLLSEATTGLPGSAQTFTYDNLNRLTKAASGSYAYDKADNPTTVAGTSGFSYDAANQLLENPSSSFSYDQLGERTGTTPTSGQPTSYGYDQAGRLMSVTKPKEGETPGIEASFTYDGGGLRAAKTVGGLTTYFTWDGTNGLPLLLSEDTMSYIYGPYGLPVERIDGSGVVTLFHHDGQGSTRALTNTGGSLVATYSYDPFGNVTGKTGTASTSLLYDSQYTDAETGLQYLRARHYDSKTAQFISVDPLSFVTESRYVYASNNPLNLSDPSGLCNWNPFSGSFWTEGNCISESSLNPIPYYEREIEAIEAGCSYWDAVSYGVKGAVVAATDVTLGAAALRLAAGGGLEIVFGHGARHLVGTGLSQAEVEASIQAQVAQQAARGASLGEEWWGTVSVNGQTIQYRAYVLPDGTVNVGTYYPL
jgi:RHS repeat-associated protein